MKRLVVPLLIGLVGALILVRLGTWQVQRLQWKEAVLAEIDARIAGDPVPLPARADPVDDRYLPVTATGTITGDEMHVLVSAKGIGPAFRIVAAFETDDGRRVLLDRGVVPDEAKDDPRPPVEATVTGNLHWPDEVDGFTPDPEPARNIWYAREVDRMAAVLEAEPLLIVLRTTTETDPPVIPFPVSSEGIPNDHLEYAVTWFGLAVVWVGMTLMWLVRLRRGRG